MYLILALCRTSALRPCPLEADIQLAAQPASYGVQTIQAGIHHGMTVHGLLPPHLVAKCWHTFSSKLHLVGGGGGVQAVDMIEWL